MPGSRWSSKPGCSGLFSWLWGDNLVLSVVCCPSLPSSLTEPLHGRPRWSSRASGRLPVCPSNCPQQEEGAGLCRVRHCPRQRGLSQRKPTPWIGNDNHVWPSPTLCFLLPVWAVRWSAPGGHREWCRVAQLAGFYATIHTAATVRRSARLSLSFPVPMEEVLYEAVNHPHSFYSAVHFLWGGCPPWNSL